MAEPGVVTEIPPLVNDSLNNGTGNITISFEETMLAYGSLYGMAVFCIIVGSIRSVWFVHVSSLRVVFVVLLYQIKICVPLEAFKILAFYLVYNGIPYPLAIH